MTEVQMRAEEVRQEVETTVAARVHALQQRQEELLQMIDELSKTKCEVLDAQLRAILAGTCPPAQPEDPDANVDPGLFFLDADAVINFRLGEEDFLESIPKLGRIGESSTYASRSYAKGPGLGILKTGNLSSLWVCTCDKNGGRRSEGGDSVVVSLSAPQDFSEVQVEDAKDGRYKVTFVPSAVGEYSMAIAVGPPGSEEAIGGSPFAVQVRPPTDYSQVGLEPEGSCKIADPSGSSKPGSMKHPGGLAFDHTGKFIFVVDQGNNRVQVFDAEDQQLVCTFGKKGLGAGCFDSPCDICADNENLIMVSDLLNHRIVVLQFEPRARSLEHVRTAGQKGAGPGQLQFPKGVGLTEHGHLLVCDSGNHRVQVFNTCDDFAVLRVVGCQGTGDGLFNSPLGVAANAAGEMLVSDASNRIQVFDASGAFLRSFGSKGRKDGMFNYPVSLGVNDENALFVCDQTNHRVQVFNAATGAFLHKWGGSKKKPAEGEEAEVEAEGEEDGEPKVEFNGLRCPAGVAVNASGMVVVADFQTNDIYVF